MQIWTKEDGVLVPVTMHPASAPPIAYDVIVLVGQSNMRGVAPYEPSDQYSGVYMWDHAAGTIVAASEPLASPFPTPGMGAANTFIKSYQQNNLASGRRLLVVNTAVGGTGFTTPSSTPQGDGFHWRYDLADDANNLARRAAATVRAASAQASPARIAAILANHGSTDGMHNVPKAEFKGYLTDWINWFRSELNTDAPYLMMQMRPDLVANETRHAVIDEAQTEVAGEMYGVVKGVSPTNPEAYAADSVHFSAIGMREIGNDLYTRYVPPA